MKQFEDEEILDTDFVPVSVCLDHGPMTLMSRITDTETNTKYTSYFLNCSEQTCHRFIWLVESNVSLFYTCFDQIKLHEGKTLLEKHLENPFWSKVYLRIPFLWS
jgi:hypothetical protein